MYKQYYRKIYKKLLPRWIPSRVLICLMIFTCCWTNYMFRLQMPILAVPMIKALPGNVTEGVCRHHDPTRVRRALAWLDPGAYLEDYILEERLKAVQDAVDEQTTNIRLPRQADQPEARPPDAPIQWSLGLPFDWKPEIRGQLIAAYSYGNVPGNFLGGVMAMRWGAKKAILWTSILSALISLFSPIAAQIHWSFLFVMRVITGFAGGVTFPACHTLISRWAPPAEKSRFVWSILGGTFGTVFTYPMIAVIAEKMTWEQGWYIASFLMALWIFFWCILAYDSPEEHPGITEEEKQYIISAQAGSVMIQRPTLRQTPIKAIFTSVPFISLVLCHFGTLFLLFFYQNAMMLYLTKALGFDLTKGGLTAGMPWGGRIVSGFIFSWIGDTFRRKEIVSLAVLRKGATLFSHFVPGIFLILVGYVGCNLVLANVFLILALTFNGAATLSSLSNNQDLSPNFAGFLYGIMNTVGGTSGIIISPLVEEIAGKHGNPIDRWQILFWIGAAVCITCTTIFIIGGSTNIQPWNEIQPERDTERGEGRQN